MQTYCERKKNYGMEPLSKGNMGHVGDAVHMGYSTHTDHTFHAGQTGHVGLTFHLAHTGPVGKVDQSCHKSHKAITQCY